MVYLSGSIKPFAGIDPPIYVWIYRLFKRTIKKAWSHPGSFGKDFLSPSTSIIVLAFKRQAKKSRNWTKTLAEDRRWRRITDTDAFQTFLRKTGQHLVFNKSAN